MLLTPTEVRIIGSLIEKEATTPDVYPLSLNALTNACNQSSNRDPVMELGEDAVRWAINNLRQQSLVRAIQRSDSRVMKYQHLMQDKLDLDGAALAVMCVLMLRGAQTPGEIRGRTGRQHEFASISDVEQTLEALAVRELVAEVPRRPGQKEARYAHLLSGPVVDSPSPSEARADNERDRAIERPRQSEHESADRLAALEVVVEETRRELTDLRADFEALKRQLGES